MDFLVSLISVVAALAVFIGLLAAVGTPIVKVSVKQISWVQAARASGLGTLIGFGSCMAVAWLIEAFVMLSQSGPLPPTFFGDFAIPGMVLSAWLITWRVRREGFAQSFPGAGAKVVVGWIAFSWIVFGVVFAAAKLFA